MKVVRLGQKGYLDKIEMAVSSGDVVLIENIEENIDPVLEPLLGRNLIKKGRYVKMGDKEVEYNKAFKLILQTKVCCDNINIYCAGISSKLYYQLSILKTCKTNQFSDNPLHFKLK